MLRHLQGHPRLFIHLLLLTVFGVAVSVGPSAQTAVTPPGQGRGEPTTITGGLRWSEDASQVRVVRYRFSAGSRSNWHTHTGRGQLLMIEEGRGRHQVRGGPVEEILPGQPWFTPAGVEHWHGAAPDQEALQLTIQVDAPSGSPSRAPSSPAPAVRPVTDEEYLRKPSARR
jgi:quercetin dioxygenase-like cupin family protein